MLHPTGGHSTASRARRLARWGLVALTLCAHGLSSEGFAKPPPTAPAGTRQHQVKVPHLGLLRYLVHLPPGGLPTHTKLPLVVLLHGLGGYPESWLVDAGIGALLDAAVKSKRLPPCLIVMPQGDSGYWADWIDGEHPWARWLTKGLLADVRARYPVRSDPAGVAIVGASMGGFGALSAALRHPELFGFAVSLSGTDVELATQAQPHRRTYTRVWGDPIRGDLLRRVNPNQLVCAGAGRTTQQFLLGWGSREPAKFAKGGARVARAMRARHLDVHVRTVPGKGHGWRSAWAPLQGWWISALGRWLRRHPASQAAKPHASRLRAP